MANVNLSTKRDDPKHGLVQDNKRAVTVVLANGDVDQDDTVNLDGLGLTQVESVVRVVSGVGPSSLFDLEDPKSPVALDDIPAGVYVVVGR